MKNLFVLIVFVISLFTCFRLFSQISESFETGLPTSYNTTTTYNLSSGTWTGTANQVIRSTTGVKTGTYSLQLRSQTGAQVISPTISNVGVSTVTFWGSSSTTSGSVQVNYSVDGGTTWVAAAGSPFSLTTGSALQKTATINSNNSNIKIQIYRTAATVYIDDINIVAYTPPSNSGCVTITSLSLPTTQGSTTTTGSQTTCGRGNDFPVNSFGSSLYGDGEDAVWSITVPSGGGNYQFDLGGSGTYKILSLHSSCTPSNGNVLSYTTTSSGTSGTFSKNLTAGTYYLWTDTWPSPDCGQYSITVTKLADPSPPPTNDGPSGATQLNVNELLGYVTYNNESATLTTGVPSPGCANLIGEDVWFKIAVPNNITILEFDTQTGTITDGGMAIYRGTPGSLTLIECDDDDGLDGLMPWISRDDFIPGETIYIRFWEYGGGTGTFKMFVSTPQALPVELLYFEGVRYPTFNNLKWATSSEQNSSYFDIERSEDGEDWRVIGSKSSAGNSQSLVNYYYLDFYNKENTVYYRLVQYDIDGEYVIYGPIVLEGFFSSKKIVKYINLAGQEVNEDYNGVLLEVYEDGTMKKIIR